MAVDISLFATIHQGQTRSLAVTNASRAHGLAWASQGTPALDPRPSSAYPSERQPPPRLRKSRSRHVDSALHRKSTKQVKSAFPLLERFVSSLSKSTHTSIFLPETCSTVMGLVFDILGTTNLTSRHRVRPETGLGKNNRICSFQKPAKVVQNFTTFKAAFNPIRPST